ncbi:MAG: lytic transglycosylase domain-containing protein [Gammaproteobacteria bacterium]
MKKRFQTGARFLLLGVVLAAFGMSSAAPVRYPRTPFIEIPELRHAVEFWRQVFAVWRQDQVALHDNEHLNLVYEVMDLPGATHDSLTSSQRATVELRRKSLESRLREMERRVRARSALSKDQQRLFASVVRRAGRHAVMGASTRLRTQRGIRERFKRGVELSGRYDGLLRQVFREARLPEDLAYLPHLESSFVSRAHSSAGAVGIWQFMPATGRSFLRMNRAVDERYDPVLAAHGAARYLGNAHAKLGDWGLAVTSYNHGVSGMLRAKRQFGIDFPRIVRSYRGRSFGFSSRNFYAEFLAVRSILSRLSRYFPEGIRFDAPHDQELVELTRDLPVTRLASMYRLSLAELSGINPAWTSSARRGSVSLPAGTRVWLPANAARPANAAGYARSIVRAGRPVRHVALRGAAHGGRPDLPGKDEARRKRLLADTPEALVRAPAAPPTSVGLPIESSPGKANRF